MASKRGLARLAARHVAHKVRSNPKTMAELAPLVNGGAGFVGSRLASSWISKFVAQRWPTMAATPYVDPIVSAGIFGALWWLGDRVPEWLGGEYVKKHQVELLVGAGIALAQSLATTFAPGLAWFLGLTTLQQVPAPQPQLAQPQSTGRDNSWAWNGEEIEAGGSATDYGNEGDYYDEVNEVERNRPAPPMYAVPQPTPPQQAAPPPAPPPQPQTSDMDDEIEDLSLGEDPMSGWGVGDDELDAMEDAEEPTATVTPIQRGRRIGNLRRRKG